MALHLTPHAPGVPVPVPVQMALVVPAVFLVVWQPAAGGSGIPEIISYLNGVKPAKILAPLTGVAKMGGMMLSVSSGLAIGPEAPTIHFGAILTVNVLHTARWLTKSMSVSIHGALTELCSDNNERIFVVGGVAAGIATVRSHLLACPLDARAEPL